MRDQLPKLKKIVVFDMEGLRDFDDAQVISLVSPARPGPPASSATPDGIGRARGGLQGGRFGKSWSIPRHNGTPQRRHAQPRRVGLHRARLQHADRPRRARRMYVFLATVPHRRTHGRRVFFTLHRRAKLNFVENPKTVPENVREIAPTAFTAVPRVWEKFYSGVMIALKEAGAVQQAAYGWAIGVGQRVADHVLKGEAIFGWFEVAKFRLARLLVLDNVRKLIGIHSALPRHRRGAHFAGSGALVFGTGCAYAGGVGHDGNLRRLDRYSQATK